MSLCALSFALCAGMVSCEKTPDNSYEGTNYIYLSSDNTSMYGMEGESITVNVMLTTSLDEDAEINFEVKGGEGIVELEGNPVLIPAGETTASFDIVCSEGIDIAENTVLSVELLSGPDKLAVRDPFQFTVIAFSNPDLSEEQLKVVADYYEATGIDLTRYIGLINVDVVYTSIDPDTEEPVTKNISGSTAIVLSDASEPGKPVLTMTSNAMGLQDEFYSILRSCTVGNDDWYLDATDEIKQDYGVMCYTTLCNAINWSAESEEVFTMALDNIVLNADKTVSFLGTKVEDEEDPESGVITVVPFDFSFSAYDREKAAIADGSLVPDDTWLYDCTADPDALFNYSDVTKDTYESFGTWIAPEASISNEKLEFVFSTDYTLAYDYMRIVATYTPAE